MRGADPHPCALTNSLYQRWWRSVWFVFFTAAGGRGSHWPFESDRDGNLAIYLMNADGSEQTPLTGNPAPDYLPAWSP